MPMYSEVTPFQIGPVSGPRVLLFHGLTGSPLELWPLGQALAAIGYRVEAPLWRGHGLTPEALLATSASDLIAQARSVLAGEPPEAIIGLSMGALLATIAASESPSVLALVLLAPAVRLAGPNALFDQLGRMTRFGLGNTMLPKRPAQPMPACDAFPDLGSAIRNDAARAARDAACEMRPGDRYARIPLRWSTELGTIRAEAQIAARAVTVPVMLLHGRLDLTADPNSSLLAARWFRSECHVRFFQRSPHVLTLGPERALVAADVAEFLDRHVPIARAAQTA